MTTIIETHLSSATSFKKELQELETLYADQLANDAPGIELLVIFERIKGLRMELSQLQSVKRN